MTRHVTPAASPLTSPLVRLGAPVLLFVYGTLRLIDGRDGHHDKDGALWNVGHVCFLISFVLLGVLTVHGYRALRPAPATPVRRGVALAATAAGVFGAACFLWVIVGDLFPSFPALPDGLQIAGPALFQVGLLALLVLLVLARLIPVWSPVLVVAAFAAIGVNLDLIPVAAVLLFAGLLLLGRSPRAVTSPAL
ncbi:hypothetical protein GCM10010532_100230 [Dactylosporangium siamense]|uniref:Uncharacterized protein n=1 Tax=Dactylosporangium siamense TaxID=685454 RepID=A0A919PWG0_9ACTN|nr:hypothetical protein Dsi01nite_094450 [Dactylosporangium siamense]